MYDLIIIGGGPGGLSAGLYASRAQLKTLIIEEKILGGQIGITASIENYPGGLDHESGSSLIERMEKQARKFGCEILFARVTDVELDSKVKKVILSNGEELETRSIIIATGAAPRKLDIEGERRLTGKGVSYCATCDADFFTDLEVFVVGARNSAVEEAIYLCDYARKVTLLVRREKLRCDDILEERAKNKDNLFISYHTSIKEFRGEAMLDEMVLIDNRTNEEYLYKADEDDGLFGVFVFVGADPKSEIFQGKLDITEDGYIKTDERMKTSVDLVYAVGDIRNSPLKQVITAASDGSIAAVSIEKELKSLDY